MSGLSAAAHHRQPKMTIPDPDPTTTPTPPAVDVDGATVRIRDLTISGPAAEAVIAAAAEGRDPAEVVRRMLDIGGMVLQHGASSALVDAVVQAVQREVGAQARVREVSEQVAAKGMRYEQQVRPVLEAVFGAHGDTVEDTSTVPGVDGRSKQGDFVAYLNEDATAGRDRRVVVEVKDRPTQRLRGKDGALTYLLESMANRDAEAGIFVCATPVPALEAQRLRVYSGNRLLVLFDKEDGDPLALEVACQLARAMAANALGDENAGIDRPILAAKVAQLTEIIEAATEIRGGVLEAKRGIARVEVAYDRLRADALAVIAELEDRLAT